MTTDHRYTPHGHTPANCRPEPRVVVKVTIRADQMSQMLPDGRAYGPGEHTIQVYTSDLKQLLDLHETREDLLVAARERAEALTVEWCEKHHATPAECPINVPAEFRALARRDLLPISSYVVLETLPPLDEAVKMADEARVLASTQVANATLADAIARGIVSAQAQTQQQKNR